MSIAAQAAIEWRRENIKPRQERAGEPANELTQAMRRDLIREALDFVPRDVVAAQLALEAGDDGFAKLYLQRVVLAVRAAARTFDELDASNRANMQKREAAA